MGTNVFINNDEACSRAANGKSAACFPDPCWSPPSPPAGPIVLPYPNTATAKSLKNGTTSVFIKKTPVALEDKSFFSTSSGNEAATQAFAKGVVSHVIKGKAYFVKWSQNVKFQGKGVCRHADLMTHNHGSNANTSSNHFFDNAQKGSDCYEDKQEMDRRCGEAEAWKTEDHCPKTDTGIERGKPKNAIEARDYEDSVNESYCLLARKCRLIPDNTKGKECCKGQTAHHLLPDAMFKNLGGMRGSPKDILDHWNGVDLNDPRVPKHVNSNPYSADKGLVVCVEGTHWHETHGSHGKFHNVLKGILQHFGHQEKKMMSFSVATKEVALIMEGMYACDNKCIEAQIYNTYKSFYNPQDKFDEAEVVAHSGISKDYHLLKGLATVAVIVGSLN